MGDQQLIAVVVPMLNEAANIPTFVERVVAATRALDVSLRLVFVDDGSTDDSVAVCQRTLQRVPGSVLVQLSRNFGKEAALLAGMDVAVSLECDAAILMDADLQHPPEAIPDLVREWENGSDAVIAARASRKGDSVARRLATNGFYRVMNRLGNVPLQNGEGDFRLLSRDVLVNLCALREQHRFTKGLYSWVGFKQSRLEVDYEDRAAGESKFSMTGLMSLAFSGLTSFSAKPLRYVMYLGMSIGLAAFFFGCWIVLETLLFGTVLPGYASLFSGMMFLGGVQLFAIGLVGEYVGRTYMQSKGRPPYVVRSIFRGDAP